MKLNTNLYDRIFNKVKPLLHSGRPGDYMHTKSVYETMFDFCVKGVYKLNPRTALPAAILHDCGYGFIKKKYMRMFTGQTKIAALKIAVNNLTISYVSTCLQEFGFNNKEINEIIFIIQYSDEDRLSARNPSIELQILHDLNLYDRFLPHRIKTLKVLYRDKKRATQILERALQDIVLTEIREKAARLMQDALKTFA